MLTNINPLNRHGRKRFGHAMFIKRDEEQLVDVVIGERRFRYIILLGVGVIMLKFLSANVLGFVISVVFYYMLFAYSTQEIILSSTKKRLLTISKYRYPTVIKVISIGLLIWTFLSILEYVSGIYIFSHSTNLGILENTFNTLTILPIFFFQYTQFSTNYSNYLKEIDMIITVMVNFILVIQFYFINYRFSEVNHSQISDHLIRLVYKTSMYRLFLLHIVDLILLVGIFKRISLGYLIIVILLHFIIPKKQYSELNYFGHSKRRIIPSFIVPDSENHKIMRSTRQIFSITNFPSEEKYPISIIPNEVSSYYETGLRASLMNALNQGNALGLLSTIIINLFVINSLFKFSITQNRDTLPEVFGITAAIIAGMVVTWSAFNIINRYLYRIQKSEFLMIGQNFIGRWVQNGLWIIRGDKLEGRRKKRRNTQRLLRYDRITGTQIAWGTIIFFIIFGLFLLLLTFWISVGALNIANVVFIFPFLFDLGFNFLSIKANAELGFFIISSFVLWLVIYNFYPRIYALNRPQLILDLEHLTTLGMIMKDEEDQRDAITVYTKCIVNSARSNRRPSHGRPGFFNVEIRLLATWGDDERGWIEFELGENNLKSSPLEVNEIGMNRHIIISKGLRTPADSGYPIIPIVIKQGDDPQSLEETLSQKVHMERGKEHTITLITSRDLHLSLSFEIINAFP